MNASAAMPRYLRVEAGRWLHRFSTPLRRRYYAEEWGAGAVARLSRRWRQRLGLEDSEAIGARRIEMGSGGMPQPGYLHVDRNPWAPHVEVVAPVWRLPFPDAWAEEILAIHCLEHVHPRLLLPTLREWRRVLRPGGRLRVHVPNVPQLMTRFAHSSVGEKWALTGALLGMYCTASTSHPDEITHPADHQILFDPELLRWVLRTAEFEEPLDRTTEIIDYHTKGWKPLIDNCSLVFEARKP